MTTLEASTKPESYLSMLSLTFYGQLGTAKFFDYKMVKVFVTASFLSL